MTRSRAIGNVPNAMMAEYYAQRASAGLIITEGTSPSPNGLGYARIPVGKPFLANPDLVARWQGGHELNAPDMSTFYTAGAKGYTDYTTRG